MHRPLTSRAQLVAALVPGEVTRPLTTAQLCRNGMIVAALAIVGGIATCRAVGQTAISGGFGDETSSPIRGTFGDETNSPIKGRVAANAAALAAACGGCPLPGYNRCSTLPRDASGCYPCVPQGQCPPARVPPPPPPPSPTPGPTPTPTPPIPTGGMTLVFHFVGGVGFDASNHVLLCGQPVTVELTDGVNTWPIDITKK